MNRSRILLALLLIIGAGGAVTGGTAAFFSDTESSIGNIFTAGEIDLLVDNDSYYNGNRCVNVAPENEPEDWEWVGEADFPLAGTTCDTSWPLANLNDGEETLHKFFNFTDVKPSDEGEDTISLHVQNDAWMCMDVSLTSNDENGQNEPEELTDDPEDVVEDEFDGELAQLIEMVWWADDGDNVLEDGEPILTGLGLPEDGVETLLDLAYPTPFSVSLADSQNNAWEEENVPVPANETVYIAKAWCFGGMDLEPLEQDGFGKTVDGDEGFPNGPQDRDGGGYICDGNDLGNESQTDQATLDVEFRAVQARHNEDFVCEIPGDATLTLQKTVENGSDGAAEAADWTLTATGPTNISAPGGVVAAAVLEGNYVLGEEAGIPGYIPSQYSCVVNGGDPVAGNEIALAEGDVAVCTITNTLNVCTPGVVWADAVVMSDQGKRKDGTPILASRIIPTTVLGPAETAGNPSDVVPPGSTFYSLGFNTGTTSTRSITVRFDNNVILNGPGADLRVYEVTGGVYPDETATIEASQDGIAWTTLAPNAVRDEDLDLGSLAWAKFIRVVDITALGTFEPTADSFDLDAIEALNCAAPLIQ